MTGTTKPAEAEMTMTGLQYERPPIKRLTMDVTLRNTHAEPRWFILPDRIAIPPLPVKIGVDGVEVFALGGKGRVVIGRFSGTGRFQAIFLPAHARVKLKSFTLSFRGELPKRTLPVEIITAAKLTLDGNPAEAWVGSDFISDAEAEVSEEHRKTLRTFEMPGHQEVPYQTHDEQQFTVQVPIPAKL